MKETIAIVVYRIRVHVSGVLAQGNVTPNRVRILIRRTHILKDSPVRWETVPVIVGWGRYVFRF